MTRLSVIGRACRLPGAGNVDEFWDLLVDGRCTVTRVPEKRFSQAWYLNPRRGEPGKSYTFAAGILDDIWGFDPGVFAITPREARQMDPQQRLLLQLVWEALEDAGVPPSDIAGRRIGVYVGASSMDYSHRQFFDPAGTDSYLMTGNTLSLVSNRISYIFDLKGPSLTIDTACSSSLVALDYAAQDLRSGRVDTAIIGGVNALLSPFNFMGFCAASMLSPDGLCRPFDHRGNGYVRAEGGVVMILERDGVDGIGAKRNYGGIVASAMNADGRTPGVALPSSEQQAALLRTLYDGFAIDPDRLAFVEAHGTGTLVGDPAEANALGVTLGRRRARPLPIGSAKSNVGHLEPASGLVGLLKAQLALEHGLLPRSLHVEKLNPHIAFDDLNLAVATEPLALADAGAAPHLAGVNNFGFGGTNVHVVIEAPPHVATSTPGSAPPAPIRIDTGHRDPSAADLLMVSAHCTAALAAHAKGAAAAVRRAAEDGVSHRTVAAALAHRRERLPERLVVRAKTSAAIAEALEAFAASETSAGLCSGRAVARSAKVALVFSGNGAQWPGMGRAAFDSSATFRRHFRAVDDHYRGMTGDSLEALLFADDLADHLGLTEIAQPLLFALHVALARALEAQGLVVSAVLGHSVGEVAAAHIAGALDLAQATAVIRARSHHQELVAGKGLMAAVQAPAADVEHLIADSGLASIDIAAFNSPRSVTVSGAPDEIQAFARLSEKARIPARVLDINYPFHSARLDDVEGPLLETLAGLAPRSASCQMFSTVTGALVDGTALGPRYWWDNVRKPVRFEAAVRSAAEAGVQVFVEIGPRSILRKYVADSTAGTDLETRIVTTLETADQPAAEPVRAAFARALAAGADFDSVTAFGADKGQSLGLPAYPWQNKEFLFQQSPEALETFATANRPHPLLGLQLRPEDYVWDSHLDTGMVAFLADHCVAGKPIMPGTGFVEMALTAAAQNLATREIELRDLDFVQALELGSEACQAVRTRIDLETATIDVSSRPRLTDDERQTHVRTRFARLPSESRPAIVAPARETQDDAPVLGGIYRLAGKFGLDYGPAFQRITACREIGDDIIEVELSGPAPVEITADSDTADADRFILHPVDFDACFHGLNVVFERLVFGETKRAYVPVHVGRLRVFAPGRRITTARIHLASYNVRAVRAGFELFAADGTLIAIADNVRFRASSLVHRVNLAQAAYHIDCHIRPLPGRTHLSAAPALEGFAAALRAAHLPAVDVSRFAENRLLLEMAARRAAYDVVRGAADADGVIDLARDAAAANDAAVEAASDNDNVGSVADRIVPRWRHDNFACRSAMTALVALLGSGGLARALDDGRRWRLAAPETVELPLVDEIVAAILEDDPAWQAECTILLRAAAHLADWLRASPDTVSPDADTEAEDDARAAAPQPAAVFSPALLEHVYCAAPEAELRIAAIAETVRQAIRAWAPGRPLRILQLGIAAGGLTRVLEPVLAEAHAKAIRARLVVADTDESWVGRIATLHARSPAIETVHVDATLDDLAPLGPFDLVVSAGGLHGLDNVTVLLGNLGPHLAGGALAAVAEIVPSTCHDVVFAGTRGWFDGVFVDGVPRGRLRDSERWSALLATAGLSVAAPEYATGDAIPGSCLILATHAAATDEADAPCAAPTAAMPALVLSPQRGPGHAVAEALRTTLDAAGRATALELRHGRTPHDATSVANGTANGSINGNGNGHASVNGHARTSAIADLFDADGETPDIVFVSATAPDCADPAADLLAATTALTHLLQSLQDRRARVWILAIGGARALLDLGPASPVEAGVWGFARSAINEYADLEIRLVDLSADLAPDAAAPLVASLMESPPELAELVVTPNALHGLEVRRGGPPARSLARTQAKSAGNLAADGATVLELTEQGDLNALRWIARDRRPPAPGEVEIEVAATGLNFRDVMWSLGLLPEEALEDGFAGPTVGFECSGRIVRVGDGVEDFAPGDHVIAMAPACFASHVTVIRDAVAKLPDNVELTYAATIPVAFLTASYALDHLAGLRRDEWVLIHGAAGGVGLAAVQVARRAGARIIATAGSDEKRNVLRALGADHVLDSRSLEFADDVRRLTGGGVDVALNALAGEAMERTIDLMRPFGRFLELGKRDFYANTKIGLRPFRRNVSYFGIDADQLLTYRPDVVRRVFSDIVAAFADGTFTALPHRSFQSASVVDAFRLMQKSGHIGKILVAPPPHDAGEVLVQREFTARADATHILVGGTGGFGLEMARWLADRGASHLLLTSRSGSGGAALDALTLELGHRGVELRVARCDATNADALAALLDTERAIRPIAGIAHTAMVLDDGLIRNLTPERIAKVLAPKVAGAHNLDRFTRCDELDYFLLFSSAAALFGNPGQASYTAANGYLDGLAQARRAAGLKAIAIAWGAISDVGVLTREADTAQSLARHTGGIDFRARDGLDLLAHLLVRDDVDETCANVALATMNWSMAADMLAILKTPAYALIRREAAQSRGDLGDHVDMRAAIQGLDDAAARAIIAEYLVREVAAIFRMPVEDISLKRSLADLGMDSLMGLELRMAAQRGLGIEIPIVSIADGTTINDIAARVLPRLRGGDDNDPTTEAPQDSLIEKHVSETIDEQALARLERRVIEHERGLQKVV